MRRFLVAMLCMIFAFSVSVVAIADDNGSITLDELLALHGLSISQFDGYELRDVERTSNDGFRMANKTVGKAIVLSSHEGNDYQETVLFVYDANNNVIAPNTLLRGSPTFKGHNVSVKVTSKYHRYFNDTELMNFYRPYYVSASWTTSSSTAKVTKFIAEYSVYGERYKYPECTSGSNLTRVGSGRHYVTCIKSNPDKGQPYSKTNTSTYAFHVAGSPMYGGTIAVDVTTDTGSWSDSTSTAPSASMSET